MIDDHEPLEKTVLNRKPTQANNIFAVASGKGGVGKTWFSVTLTHALAKAGNKVLLFDGDLGLANVDVQLGLMPTKDINAVVEGKLPLNRVIMRYEEGGFDIIAGQSGAATLSSLPMEKVVEIRDSLIELASEYDYVVIDLGAGVDRTVRLLSGAAGKAIVVTNEEPTALTDAYAFIKLTHAAGLAENIQVVVNQIPSKNDGEKIYNTLAKVCQNFLKIRPPLLGMIREDRKVPDSIRHQTPLLTRHPNSPASVDVEVIAAQIVK